MKPTVNYYSGILLISSFLSALSLHAQWMEKNNGLYGGRITSLAKNSRSFFAGTNNGVFRSLDKGTNWQDVNTGLSELTVNCLAANDDAVFVGIANGGLYKSTDDGATWHPSNQGLPRNDGFISSIAVSENKVFTSLSEGLFFSNDNGATWSATSPALNAYQIYEMIFHKSKLYVGASEGLFYSEDNGSNWINVGLGDLSHKYVSHLTSDDNNLFASVSGIGTYKTSDNGLNWTLIEGKYLMAPVGDKLIAAEWFDGIYSSGNAGDSWERNGFEFVNRKFNCILTDGPIVLVGIFNGGIVRSTNSGVDWESSNTGIDNVYVSTFAATDNAILAGTYGSGIFRSVDDGKSWTEANDGVNTDEIRALIPFQDKIFAATMGNGLLVSDNDGLKWDWVGGVSAGLTTSLAVSGDSLYVGTADAGVFRSTDGQQWTAVNDGLNTLEVMCLFVKGNTRLAGTDREGVYVSRGHQEGWTKINGSLDNKVIASFVATKNKIFANANQGIFESSDNGATWSLIQIGSSPVFVNYIGVIDDKLVASDYQFVYVSSDEGKSWFRFSSNVNNSTTLSASIQYGTDVFVGTNIKGVWSMPVDEFCMLPKPTVTIGYTDPLGPILTSSASSGNQWYLNDQAINGATSVQMVVKEVGVYSVKVTAGKCMSEFSNPVNILITGMDDGNSFPVVLYPNPVSNILILSSHEKGKKKIWIYTAEGIAKDFAEVLDSDSEINVRDYSPGIYIIKIQTEKSVAIKKFIKN